VDVVVDIVVVDVVVDIVVVVVTSGFTKLTDAKALTLP